jgi:hypothetical protein
MDRSEAGFFNPQDARTIVPGSSRPIGQDPQIGADSSLGGRGRPDVQRRAEAIPGTRRQNYG